MHRAAEILNYALAGIHDKNINKLMRFEAFGTTYTDNYCTIKIGALLAVIVRTIYRFLLSKQPLLSHEASVSYYLSS